MGDKMNFFISLILVWPMYNIHGQEVAQRFRDSYVTPDLVAKAPQTPIQAFFDGVEILLGSRVPVKRVENEPKLKFQFDSNFEYVALCADVDTDACPEGRQTISWLVGNIKNGDVKKGIEIFSYQPPTPLPSRTHRFACITLQQKDHLSDKPDAISNIPILGKRISRECFDTQAFINKNDLTLSGGTFFYVQN